MDTQWILELFQKNNEEQARIQEEDHKRARLETKEMMQTMIGALPNIVATTVIALLVKPLLALDLALDPPAPQQQLLLGQQAQASADSAKQGLSGSAQGTGVPKASEKVETQPSWSATVNQVDSVPEPENVETAAEDDKDKGVGKETPTEVEEPEGELAEQSQGPVTGISPSCSL